MTEKFKGRKLADSTKEKLRNRIVTEEWRISIGNASRGRKHSSETIAKINAVHIGRKNSCETIIKMKEAAKRRWDKQKSAML